MKYRDLIKKVEADGWQFLRQTGSHGQWKHPSKPGLVTIVVKPGKDVPIGTLKSILTRPGWISACWSTPLFTSVGQMVAGALTLLIFLVSA